MQVSFGNRKIATTQSLKFLGLTIDTSLTWKFHIGELATRVNKASYAIRLINPYPTAFPYGNGRFYTSTSNKRAARPKLYTKSLTRDKTYV